LNRSLNPEEEERRGGRFLKCRDARQACSLPLEEKRESGERKRVVQFRPEKGGKSTRALNLIL